MVYVAIYFNCIADVIFPPFVDETVHKLLIPLRDITIPPGYLLPNFKAVEKKAKRQEEYDIFCFDNRSIQETWEDCVRTHIRDNPASHDVPISSNR